MSVPSPLVSSWSPSLLIGFRLKKYVCPAFNCCLNLAASCLDDENEILSKVIASFSAVRFALLSIPLIVLHSLVRSVFWSMVLTTSINFCHLCMQMHFWMSLFSLCSLGEVGSRLVITSSISAGTGSLWSLWCDAALSRIVQNINLLISLTVFWNRMLAQGVLHL